MDRGWDPATDPEDKDLGDICRERYEEDYQEALALWPILRPDLSSPPKFKWLRHTTEDGSASASYHRLMKWCNDARKSAIRQDLGEWSAPRTLGKLADISGGMDVRTFKSWAKKEYGLKRWNRQKYSIRLDKMPANLRAKFEK